MVGEKTSASRLANETAWDEAALERRVQDLAQRALSRWPWQDETSTSTGADDRSPPLRWRIGGGAWNSEDAASQMVLNVAAELLTCDPANAERLSGDAISSNVHLASRYPAGTKVGALTLRAVPGHESYVLWPYAADYQESAVKCRKMGERCDVAVEAEFEQDDRTKAFWRLFKEQEGGVPGQRDTWRGASQWTTPLNSYGDRVSIYVGNELLWLFIRGGGGVRSGRGRNPTLRVCPMPSDDVTDGVLADPEVAGDPAVAPPAVDGIEHLRSEAV